MIPLTARDALLPKVLRVSAEERPLISGDPPDCLYAVFTADNEKRFQGLVSAKLAAEQPHRIFADLVQEQIPCVIIESSPLDLVLKCMEVTDRYHFPVVDAKGNFIGATTRSRILETLLYSYSRLLVQNRDLIRQMFVFQEQERRHLSRELHDELGQYLTALKIDLGHLRMLHIEKKDIEKQIIAIERVLAHLQTSVQRIMHWLRPEMLDHLGIADTLRELVAEYQQRNPSVAFSLQLSGDLNQIPEDYAITIFRVVQESLTNVIRHAKASSVRICLCLQEHCPHPICKAFFSSSAWEAERVHLMICDNGIGMSAAGADRGMGMIGMQERVEALGGTFQVQSQLGKGLWIIVELPLPEA